MKNMLFGGLILVGALLNAPVLHAQDVPMTEATLTASPAPSPEINVDVQAPAPDVNVQLPPQPAPAPDINVQVPAPSAPSTHSETKETSVTRVIQHQPENQGSDLAFLLVGGGIAALAVAGLFAASTRR